MVCDLYKPKDLDQINGNEVSEEICGIFAIIHLLFST